MPQLTPVLFSLQDVLSLRKASGEVTGDIRVNGHPQEPNSFRRMTGYVEQFDVQSPQLTIRETVEFSAKMRLDESIPLETKLKFVDHVLKTLELDTIAGHMVGDDTGGLSFEQKKRLSIAVELASNPSCIFLDEPTSGLDARLVTFTHIWNLLTYLILSYGTYHRAALGHGALRARAGVDSLRPFASQRLSNARSPCASVMGLHPESGNAKVLVRPCLLWARCKNSS